jgi:hypothetical protein
MSTCLLASIIGRSGPAFSQNTGWLADKIPDKRIYGRFLENGAISVDPTRSFTQQLTRSDICVSDEGHPHFYVWRPLDWPACEHVFFCPGFFVLRVRVWHCETPSLTAETKIELRSSKNPTKTRTALRVYDRDAKKNPTEETKFERINWISPPPASGIVR